ncbi:MAG: hypothetical protein WCI12_02425 [Actinomycetes bacterium]
MQGNLTSSWKWQRWLMVTALALPLVGLATTGTTTAGASEALGAPTLVRDPSTIAVPVTFAPGDVSSPIDKAVATLEAEFPADFGGLSADTSGRFSVAEVEVNPDLEVRAQTLFDAIPAQLGVEADPVDLRLNFIQVRSSVADLLALKASVLELAKANAELHINGVGIDQLHNRVLVATGTAMATTTAVSSSPLDATDQELVTSFGSSSLEFQQAPPATLSASRYADSAPFNAGDQLTMPTVYGNIGCTSGPGVHFSSGWHLILTAGHCSWAAGTNFSGNLTAYNGSTIMGPFIASSTGTSTSTWYDTGLISASSSNITWAGAATRIALTGWATAVAGASACSEGSYGGERCAQVISTNETKLFADANLPGGGEWVGGLTRLGIPTVAGDSGGIVVENSIYGPLAVGTNVGTGASSSWSEDITVSLYLWSQAYGTALVVNTVLNP